MICSDDAILHFGRNDTLRYEATEIVDNVDYLLKPRSFILEKISTAHVMLSKAIIWTDNEQYRLQINEVSKHLEAYGYGGLVSWGVENESKVSRGKPY